jgi:hypothetical protein
MPVYPQRNDDPRALARTIASLERSLEATRRRRAGNTADPTPPPVEVAPGALTGHLLEEAP